MAVCALIRGGMRYAEQFMNHNVAFRLLALFRAKAFAALRRLAPAKLAGKGKGDLIALVTTDVELLEIFFAHTISPVVIAIVTTVVYALALLTLSPPLAATLIIAHLIIGVILPRLFASAVRGIGPELRKESSALDDEMLDDMRGIGEIIRFGQGDARLASIQRRTRSLWVKRVRLSVKNGDFAGFGAVLVMLFTAIAAFLAMTLCTAVSTAADMSEGLMWVGSVESNAPALVAAFVLLASSFGPTLALSALPANLTQTFASARRLFALMDEAPAVVEQGGANARNIRHDNARCHIRLWIRRPCFRRTHVKRAVGACDWHESGTPRGSAILRRTRCRHRLATGARPCFTRCFTAGHSRYSRPVRAWKINDVETADALLGSGFRHDFAVGCSIAAG